MKYYTTDRNDKVIRVRDKYVSQYYWDGKRWGDWYYLKENPLYWGEKHFDLKSLIEITKEECYNKIEEYLMIRELVK